MGIKFSRPGFELLLPMNLLLNFLGVKMPVVEGIAELPRGRASPRFP